MKIKVLENEPVFQLIGRLRGLAKASGDVHTLQVVESLSSKLDQIDHELKGMITYYKFGEVYN